MSHCAMVTTVDYRCVIRRNQKVLVVLCWPSVSRLFELRENLLLLTLGIIF